MRVVSQEEFEQEKRKFVRELKNSVFIYPTDSIYGLGCDATNPELVDKVRELKNSNIQPFSVIAPSKEWVEKHCEITPHAKEWIEQLGTLANIDGERRTFSLILKLKDQSAVAHNVLQGKDSLSVRIPDHWFSGVVAKMNVPIVTTSANPTGGEFMTSLANLHPRIKARVDLCVYEGEKHGRPSALVNLTEGEASIKTR